MDHVQVQAAEDPVLEGMVRVVDGRVDGFEPEPAADRLDPPGEGMSVEVTYRQDTARSPERSSPEAVTTRSMVISERVSVPVLSEQMTDAEPRVAPMVVRLVEEALRT